MSARPTRTSDATIVQPVLAFLRCRTPDRWARAARADLDTVLLDHASLELKAAEQAQALIRRYGAATPGTPEAGWRLKLLRKLSRLAREELRHFEQVIEILTARGLAFEPVTASRYARELHASVRTREPGRCVDTLIVGAIIEARSCERFFALLPTLEPEEPTLATFYRSLLRAEARHFQDYLTLAAGIGEAGWEARRDELLDVDARLATDADDMIRFHSGPTRS